MQIMSLESFIPSGRGNSFGFSSDMRGKSPKNSNFEQEKRRVYATIGVLTSASILGWGLIAYVNKKIPEIKAFFGRVFGKK